MLANESQREAYERCLDEVSLSFGVHLKLNFAVESFWKSLKCLIFSLIIRWLTTWCKLYSIKRLVYTTTFTLL